jgi:hypothetical protein
MMKSVVSEDEAVFVENSAAVAATVQRSHQRLDPQVFLLHVRHQLAVRVEKYLTRTTPATKFQTSKIVFQSYFFLIQFIYFSTQQ